MKQSWSEVAPYFVGDAVAHLSTIDKDGGPHVVPVWVDRHGADDLVFFTTEGSRKDRNVTRDSRVALSTTRPDSPLDMATVRGEVIRRVDGEEGFALIDQVSRAYTGEAYPQRTGLVSFIVRPTAWWAQDHSGQ